MVDQWVEPPSVVVVVAYIRSIWSSMPSGMAVRPWSVQLMVVSTQGQRFVFEQIKAAGGKRGGGGVGKEEVKQQISDGEKEQQRVGWIVSVKWDLTLRLDVVPTEETFPFEAHRHYSPLCDNGMKGAIERIGNQLLRQSEPVTSCPETPFSSSV